LPVDLAPLLKEHDVGATVLVQAAPTEAETHFLLGLAREHAFIAGVVGWVDFEAADAAVRIAALATAGAGKLKGLRPMIQDIPDPRWIARPSLDAAFEALVAHELVFDALVRPVHLEALRERLLRHPRLRAVLDHAGKPDIAGAGFDPWARQIERLAQATSVHCKLSGLLTQATPGSGAAELDTFVAHIFTCFGADRVMWGSDWPVVTLRAAYREWLNVALALVRRHAPGREEAVFSGNAIHFYRLDFRGVPECP
jgi:L-fuconolactonase